MKLALAWLLVFAAAAQGPVQEAYQRGQKALEEKRYSDAARAFDEALSAAPPGNSNLLAGLFYYKGAALGMAGEILPALASVKQALHYAPNEEKYHTLLLRLEQEGAKTVIPADQIGRAMTLSRALVAEAPGADPPSIDLWVNYDFDKDTLSISGREQAAELAKAMKLPDFAGKRFRLVGHTDIKGADDYNQKLSEHRAERLRDFLIREGLPAGEFQIEGRGKRQPKVPGDNDQANAVNRRVEVQLLD